ncbi:MAG: NUDIX domain-containing protein [Elusimicrobia bacterium]|nr:NUDIX domain-containing protein [Elusimicrobiota bacterium]
MQTKKDFSCGGLVIHPDDKRLLIVQVENLSGARVWTFPKGHPEKGEDEKQAALREVKEETGWDCRVTKRVSDTKYFFIKDGVRFFKTVRWFLMEPLECTGKPMEGEILACRWASMSEAKDLLTYPSDLKLLEKVAE